MHAFFRSFISLELGVHFPHYLFLSLHHCTSSHLIGLHLLLYYICRSFCIISFHPEWWSSLVHCMKGSHVISTIYPTDIDPRILSVKRSPRQREFYVTLAFESVYPFLTSSLELLCLCLEHTHLYICKKNKKKMKRKNKKDMCVVFSIIEYVYIDVWGSLDWVRLLMRVRMWAFRDSPFFVFTLSYILRVRWVTFS